MLVRAGEDEEVLPVAGDEDRATGAGFGQDGFGSGAVMGNTSRSKVTVCPRCRSQ